MKISQRPSTYRDLSILMGLTLLIGIYMIASTAIITKDGVLYIERAQQIPTEFSKILNAPEPFGLPILIFSFHRLLSLFITDSPFLWILSGQIGVFFCRFLTVGVLYFFGKSLFDRKQTFWAILILIFLPYPAEIGTDILRDWPHMLFLFGGLLFLYQGIQEENGPYLFTAGLLSALGCLIRPECVQVILYGIVIWGTKIMMAADFTAALRKNWFYALLVAGFLVVFIPYTISVDNDLPDKLEILYQQMFRPEAVESGSMNTLGVNQANFVSGSRAMLEAGCQIFVSISENLMYFFTIPAAIGFWRLFMIAPKKHSDRQWLIGMFISFYVMILCLLYVNWGYLSRRHVLPLAVLLCFFIPCGIEVISGWLTKKNSKKQCFTNQWFIVLMAVGMAACLPKLLRPIGYDKAHYRKASAWLAENTRPGTRIYTFDKRIPFYANRRYRFYPNAVRFKTDFRQRYLIVSAKNGKPDVPVPQEMILQTQVESVKKDRSVMIYKRPAKAIDPFAPEQQK